MSQLVVDSLTVRFGDVTAVRDVSFSIEPGQLVGILGPSGSGKTTILRAVAGMRYPTGGSITIAGTDMTRVPTRKRGVGVMFQNYALFPHMTVARNISFGLRVKGISGSELDERVQEMIAFARLEGLAERYPAQLSGGQQQRVALARALAVDPTVLLLDEPFSNLDAKVREDLRIELTDMLRRAGVTTIIVTHDQADAATMADRVVVMNHGRIEQDAAFQSIYDAPRTRFTASFIGESNRLRASVESATGPQAVVAVGDRRWTVRSGDGLKPGVDADVFVRRTALKAVVATGATPPATGNRMDCTVARLVREGSVSSIWVHVDGRTIPFVLPSEPQTLAEGDAVQLVLDPELCHAFTD